MAKKRDRKRSKDSKMSEILAYVKNNYGLCLHEETNDKLHEDIEARFDLEQVYQGQKRCVVLDKNYAYKLVNTPAGFEDNICAILTSNRLRELNEEGNISDDELSLFALVEAVDGDPFIIKAPRATRLRDDSEFSEWFKENKDKHQYHRGSRKNAFTSRYVLESKDLNAQWTKIMRIMSKYFIASDINLPIVPENYGFNDDGELMLIDMGSILPKYNSDAMVECDICGSQMNLMIPTVNPKMDKQVDMAISMKSGIYTCSNKNCEDHKSDVDVTSRSKNLSDSIRFDEYLEEVMADADSAYNLAKVEIVKTITEFTELPEDLDDLIDLIESEYDIELDRDDASSVVRNSMPFVSMCLTDDNPEALEEYLSSYQEDIGITDLEDFSDNLREFFEEHHEELPETDFIEIYTAYCYLSMLSKTADTSTFNIGQILSETDRKSFSKGMEALFDEVDADDRDIEDIFELIKEMR